MTRGEAIIYIHKHPEMYVLACPAFPPAKHPQDWCVTRAQTGSPRGVGPTLEAALDDMVQAEAERELL